VLRTVQPELLDSLPDDHPDARHSRRDLRLTNFAMGNFRWFRRTLPPLLRPGDRVLELGAGGGDLAQALRPRDCRYAGLDLCSRPADWPAAWEWHRHDLRSFAHYGDFPVVLGNLIFHQFTPAELRALGAKFNRHARLVLASEPVRHRRFQTLFAAAAALVGGSHVTRHDAHVSIAAGFLGDELPAALGLDASVWRWRCTTTAFGAYRVIALRR
jgi:hypothetical protein